MVRQYYVPQITGLSEQELRRVFDIAEPPVCLLGGWAVHLHVDPGFQEEYGREYIGSRDIDIGVHVDPDWQSRELSEKPIAKSLEKIRELGYTESRFGFVQNFHRDTQERITEEEANRYGMHEVFQVYVDVIPDTAELEAFRESFGFTPPAEPLLAYVFKENAGEPLSDHVSWSVESDAEIVPPEVLAAMKIRSLPDRDKSHKRVKDVADLHALLWYVKDYNQMKTDVLTYVSEDELEEVRQAVDDAVFEQAAGLLQIEPQLIKDSIQRL